MASAQILTNGKALYAYNGTEWVPLNTAGNLVNSTRWQFTAVGSETSLSGNDDYGDPLIYTPGYEQVYLNGVLLARDVDYTATNGTTITGLTALTAGYIVEIIAYNNINVGNTYTQNQIDTKIADTFERWTKTVSASGTVISGLDDNSVTLDYTAGLEKVYINGILLAPEEYVATSGSSVVLDEAVEINDIIQIHTLKNFRVANHYTINQTDDQFLTKTSASSTYLSQSSASSTYAPVAAGGLVQITPTSIATTGGSGSISTTGSISFTSASAVSLNGCFTSAYENYLILYNTTAATSGHTVLIRLRASGTDNSSSNYYHARNWVNYSGAASMSLFNSNGLVTAWESSYSNTNGTKIQINIFSPFSVTKTHLQWRGSNENVDYSLGAGDTSVTTSYDGFTIYPSTGNSTGSLQIYGYRK